MGMCRLIATHFLVLPGVIGGTEPMPGVGSRKTPTRILERMEAIAEALARRRDTPEGGPP